MFGTRIQGIQTANEKATQSLHATITSKINATETQISQLSQTFND